LHRTQIPAIYVTHDQEEALAIADRVLILHDGRIVRAGTPAEVWENPGSAFVAGFLGLGNIFEGTYVDPSTVQTRYGNLTVPCDHRHRSGDKIHLLARPLPAEVDTSTNLIEGVVGDVLFQQERYKVTLDHGLYVYLPKAPKLGARIQVRVKVECLA
jgi:ABC-type Fe3+/spermidine/putrescine transport system ATPase subunit